MPSLDKAMLEHIQYLVFKEHRPLSHHDFCSDEAKGQPYAMAHGTFRNKVSKFMKLGIVEIEYNAGTTFYTLNDVHFGNRKKEAMMTPSMTPNLMGVSPVTGVTNNEDDEISKTAIYKAIIELPPEQKSIHDIHLTYAVPDIYTILTTSPSSTFVSKPVSMDIHLPVLNTTDSLRIQTIVHRTDTVHVIVGCSTTPVRFDTEGIVRLSSGLTRAEERTSRIVDEYGKNMPGGYEQISIPHHMTWKVVMWHFGNDSIERAEEKFCVTWRVAQKVLGRCYTKRIKSKNYAAVRREIQETPDISLRNALNEKVREDLKHD
jgi:hypothetical protein